MERVYTNNCVKDENIYFIWQYEWMRQAAFRTVFFFGMVDYKKSDMII